MDSKQFFAMTPTKLPKDKEWFYTQSQFLLLNLAVGGCWPGYPDGTTTFPQRMIVDYLPVYSITELNQ